MNADTYFRANVQSGLAAYWSFQEEGSASRISHDGNNTLTMNGTITSCPGLFGNSASFTSGQSQYFSLTNSTVELGNTTYTFSFWFNTSVLSDYIFIGKDISGSRDYAFVSNVSTSDVGFFLFSGATLFTACTVHNMFIPNRWNFVAGGHDQSTGNIWVKLNSGSTVYKTTTGSAPNSNSGQFRIGSRAFVGANDFFLGRLQDVALWKRTLNAGELNWLYNNGLGRRIIG